MRIRALAPLVFSLAALWTSTLAAQTPAFTPDLASLERVSQLQVPVALIKSAIETSRNQPLKFAVGQTLGANTSDGSWDQPQPEIARWRLRIASGGALSMSFEISSLHLPAGAELWIYTPGGDDVQGPFTAADNGSLWSPLVRAEEAVIEAHMPYAVRDDFSLVIAQAFHGYRDFAAPGKSFPDTTGSSGRCEVNTSCSQGSAWNSEIRSAVLLTVGSSTLCSGTLVNNTKQDNRALILTAGHCGITSSSIAATTRVYFNVQKSSCASTAAGPVTQNIAGKTLLARAAGNDATDYSLFELANVPPTAYDVHYAGWDIGGSAPQSGVTIHHPQGDDKKISTYTAAARSRDDISIGGDGSSDFSVDAWEINWSSGTTEAGSSGAGLWNQAHRVVGTLSGGNGACSVLLPASNNGDSDYFARLSVAWNASSSTGKTLKQVLDSSNTGCASLDGKDRTTSAVNCVAAAGTGDSGGGGALSGAGLGVLGLLAALRWRRRHRKAG